MKNQGISLISLIITIIVIIILAAIVIFTGLGTPDSAQFASFTNDVDTVNAAVTDAFASLKVSHATSGDYRTNEQIYLEVATKQDLDQWAVMQDTDVTSTTAKSTATTPNAATSNGCQRIIPTSNNLGVALPKVRQSNEAWYVTKEGRVFNATGYIYNDKLYYNASFYSEGNDAKADKATDGKCNARATKIASVMNGTSGSLKVDYVAPAAE